MTLLFTWRSYTHPDWMENYVKRLVRGLENDNMFKNPGFSIKEVIYIPEFSEKIVLPYFSISDQNINRSNMA